MPSPAAPGYPVRRSLSTIAVLLLVSSSAPAQTAPPAPQPGASEPVAAGASGKPLEFDVASVKENKSGDGRMMWRTNPDGFTATNASLKNLISNAYQINIDLVSGGPAWADSAGFDINAKVTGEEVPALKDLTVRQRQAMLQPLLADRFHLKVHVEQKILPVYDLTVSKGGSKLRPSTLLSPGDPKSEEPGAKVGGRMMFGPGQFTADGVKLSALVNNLAYVVHRPVFDRTGLTGNYDFSVKYAPEEDQGGSKPDNGATDPLPSIFTALEEQLGLKLQSTRGPVDTLVIDHVDKPSEN